MLELKPLAVSGWDAEAVRLTYEQQLRTQISEQNEEIQELKHRLSQYEDTPGVCRFIPDDAQGTAAPPAKRQNGSRRQPVTHCRYCKVAKGDNVPRYQDFAKAQRMCAMNPANA